MEKKEAFSTKADDLSYTNDAEEYMYSMSSSLVNFINDGLNRGFTLEQVQAMLYDEVAETLLNYRVGVYN